MCVQHLAFITECSTYKDKDIHKQSKVHCIVIYHTSAGKKLSLFSGLLSCPDILSGCNL